MIRSCFPGLSMLFLSISAFAQTPEWIWHSNDGAAAGDGEVRYFRKSFEIDGRPEKARLTLAADNHAIAYINGRRVAGNDEWSRPEVVDATRWLVSGRNVLAVEGRNDGGVAALLVRLEFAIDGQRRTVVTDRSWVTATQAASGWERAGFEADWSRAVSLGKLGVSPWGDVISGGAGARGATSAETLSVLPGFEVELLHSATGAEGSWICMALDPRGRLVISPQGNRQPLLRVTLTDAGQVEAIEPIDLPLWEAMGLLHAFDSLYVNGRGPNGTGLYRVRDSDGDDRLDEVRFLKAMQGGGEHGPHGLALGPDDLIYVVNGNHTRIPDGLAAESPHGEYAEDHLLPRQWDGNGHARGVMAPGGYVARTDADGERWELVLAGFRNAYDIAFNEEGELFTYDSDMEWDWGMPWYRPTRINHCVVGAEFGWRSGTSKWPEYYPDSLPSTVRIGVGCPTGVMFGTGSAFPPKYQRAFYAMDWTYGRILAVHLTPRGASYEAAFEPFLQGQPLNVSDMVVGRDGAMYFVTGGRGTQSGLYRVSYHGPRVGDERGEDAAAANARALRRKLEAFHGRTDSRAVEFAWPHLASDDRWIRFAARIAIESQPAVEWQERALGEDDVTSGVTALLGLARKGSPDVRDRMVERLLTLWSQATVEGQKVEWTRALALTFIRMGRSDRVLLARVAGALEAAYPTGHDALDRELCQLLVYVESPGVVPKTVGLIARAATNEERLHYLFHLRAAKAGWTLEDRQQYFSWLNRASEQGTRDPELVRWFSDVGRGYGNGASHAKFLENFRTEAVEGLSESERGALADYIAGKASVPRPAPVERAFVREWTLADLEPSLGSVPGRSVAKGAQAFAAVQCVVCHRFGNEGGAVGQDLTAVASRYARREILESILQPSKVVSDQYQNTTFYLKDGDEVTGRVVDGKGGKLEVMVNPLTDFKVELVEADVIRREPAGLSPMPEGLLDVLTRDEILDLLAYLESGGK